MHKYLKPGRFCAGPPESTSRCSQNDASKRTLGQALNTLQKTIPL